MKQKLNLAVIGLGHWGPNLVRNFFEDDRVSLQWICDLDKAKAEKVATRFKGIKTTSNVRDVAEDSTVDAVVICTPTETHFEMGKLFLEEGKHVFMEKPLAQTSEECEQLIQLSLKKEKKLMVGHIFLFNSAVKYLKQLIEKNELGDLIYIYGKRLNLGPIRRDVNALWDLAPHDIAILNFLLGKNPTSVQANGVQHVYSNIHDVTFLNLRYPGGLLANLQVSWLDPRKVRQFVVIGTKRMAVFDDLDPVGPIHIYDKTVNRNEAQSPDGIQAFKAVIQEGDLIIPKVPLSEPLRNECRHFVDCLLENKPILTDGKNGLEVVQVLEAAQSSLDSDGVQMNLGASSRSKNILDLAA